MCKTPHRTSLVIAVGIGLIAALPTGAAETRPSTAPATLPAVDPKVAAEVTALVADLSHADWRRREAAQERLSALDAGGAALAERLLRDVLAVATDPEACARAQAALAHIDAMKRLGPTRVTARFDRAKPQEVFAELARQGEVPIVALRGDNLWRQRNWPAVTLDLRDEPFWGAVRRACAAAGLRAMYAGGDGEPGRIVLVADVTGEMDRPSTFGGSFMVMAGTVRRRPEFGPPPTESLQLQLTFFADPRWRVVSYPSDCKVDVLLDDRGNPLPQPAPMAMQAFKPDSPIWVMRTNVPNLPADAKRVSRLRGHFDAELLEQSDPVEVPNVLNARNQRRQAGRQAVHLNEVRREGDVYHVSLILSRNGLSPQDWRQQRESEGIQLLDAQGRPLHRGGFDAQDQGEQVVYNLQFLASPGSPAGPGPPAKLVCRIPLEPRKVKVPFELTDLEIGN